MSAILKPTRVIVLMVFVQILLVPTVVFVKRDFRVMERPVLLSIIVLRLILNTVLALLRPVVLLPSLAFNVLVIWVMREMGRLVLILMSVAVVIVPPTLLVSIAKVPILVPVRLDLLGMAGLVLI